MFYWSGHWTANKTWLEIWVWLKLFDSKGVKIVNGTSVINSIIVYFNSFKFILCKFNFRRSIKILIWCLFLPKQKVILSSNGRPKMFCEYTKCYILYICTYGITELIYTLYDSSACRTFLEVLSKASYVFLYLSVFNQSQFK